MKILVIEQDLRVFGSSQGIISRSFLAKLRKSYTNSVIDVLYLKSSESDDDLHLLPVNNIESYVINRKVPLYIKWINKLYWRIFHISLNEEYIHKVYASYIKKVKYDLYDHIFIRSAGIDHEIILATHNLPILKKAIVNFHDPYPLVWYVGSDKVISKLYLFRLKKVIEVVEQAKTCSSSAYFMSKDLEHLYISKKQFYTLHHQYDKEVFDFSDRTYCFEKTKQITICYHGAIQFGRDICVLLDAYNELVNNNRWYEENTEFVVRVKKAADKNYLSKRYSNSNNINVLGPANFSESAYEQSQLADINVILENGPLYCNILVGKAPFLASIGKPILSISPIRSELRRVIENKKYIADFNSKEDIKEKLENLIGERKDSKEFVYPFGDNFSDVSFKKSLDEILQANTE